MGSAPKDDFVGSPTTPRSEGRVSSADESDAETGAWAAPEQPSSGLTDDGHLGSTVDTTTGLMGRLEAFDGSADHIEVESFGQLSLSPDAVEEIRNTWEAMIKACNGREEVGLAIYTTMIEALPALSDLFTTPKAVQGMRYMHGFRLLVENVGSPPELRLYVETLAFKHLDYDLTVSQLATFRAAIMDLFIAELGESFSSLAQESWCKLLNYTGGAFVFVRCEFSQYIKVLSASWAIANRGVCRQSQPGNSSHPDERAGRATEQAAVPPPPAPLQVDVQGCSDCNIERKRKKRVNHMHPKHHQRQHPHDQGQHQQDYSHAPTEASSNASQQKKWQEGGMAQQHIPQTFAEMFLFNATVMGFSSSLWMREVLYAFNDIVLHISDCCRLQEECEALALKLRSCTHLSTVNFRDFKAVMLASLRSLLPREWDSTHEKAWSWLWDNVESLASSSISKVTLFGNHLATFNAKMSEDDRVNFQDDIYANFFARCPAGQEHFKQSSARLRSIADKIIRLVEDFYKEPDAVIEQLSVLGLKHVGYGIPMELFPPFVDASVEAMQAIVSKIGKVGDNTAPVLCPVDRSHYLPENEMSSHIAMEGFRWCIGLVAKMLVRTTKEGSNLVMSAIGSNSARKLQKAADTLQRGLRVQSMLLLQVGSHSISPLMLAIDTGSLEVAKAMLVDILTFRADRDHYYHGAEELFSRHPDLVEKLCQSAPSLLKPLLDGLVWRSCETQAGLRRINLYVKYFVIGEDEEFSPSLTSLVKYADPVLITHPVVQEAVNVIWTQLCAGWFLVRKAWMMLTIVVFITAQCVLERDGVGDRAEAWSKSDDKFDAAFLALVACRIFIYVFTLGELIYRHGKSCIKAAKKGDLVNWGCSCLRIPGYLSRNRMELVSFLLIPLLVGMLCTEPLVYCLIFSNCDGGAVHHLWHDLSGLGALLHYAQILDLGVLSLKIAAFKLVCVKVADQVLLWILCEAFLLLVFSSVVLALDQDHYEYNTWDMTVRNMILLIFGLQESESLHGIIETPDLLIALVVFLVFAWVCSVNMLVAQFACIYMAMYENLEGYATLERGNVILSVMPSIANKHWKRFVSSLDLDRRLEFGEGDLGLSGGVQRFEPACKNPLAKEKIHRFGGSSSQDLPFPALDVTEEDNEATQLERMIRRTVQKSIKASLNGQERDMSASGTRRSHASSHSSD
mmetsp:Transcript_38853/g.91445  ORF Transcript_38853/g.91445 Transcript_38853/m.91445 type:complete len:1189 (-) Transcript_38853:271-3837(-)